MNTPCLPTRHRQESRCATYFASRLDQSPPFASSRRLNGLPVSEDLACRILSFPLANDLADREIDRIVDCVLTAVPGPLIRQSRTNSTRTCKRANPSGSDADGRLRMRPDGHARVVIELFGLAWLEFVGLIDDFPENAEHEIAGLTVIGTSSDLSRLAAEGLEAVALGFGAARGRAAALARLESAGLAIPVLVHPTAFVARSATLGPGSQLLPRAHVGPGAKIGHGVLVNTAAIIEHDVEIGDAAVIDPGAVVAGRAVIGSEAEVGAGAVALPDGPSRRPRHNRRRRSRYQKRRRRQYSRRRPRSGRLRSPAERGNAVSPFRSGTVVAQGGDVALPPGPLEGPRATRSSGFDLNRHAVRRTLPRLLLVQRPMFWSDDMNQSPQLSSSSFPTIMSATFDRLESILTQSVQDFEIVVIDDASTDRSVELIRSYDDRRIRLLENDENLGGVASYNRAVEAARGEWLVNLDADDSIAPEKAELQLAAVREDSQLDVVGTYVSARDEIGTPHGSGVVQSATALPSTRHAI